MGYCPVCGCKTEDIDFVSKTIGESEEKICSFCQRQLGGFEGGKTPTDAQIRWLGTALAKEAPGRNENIEKYLKALQKKFAEEEEATVEAVPAIEKAPQAYKASAPVASAPIFQSEQKTIKELTQRVEALEAELKAMKRRQMIKTIIELGLPFAMLLLLIIVFFASGLYDYVKEFTNIVEMYF